LVNSEFDIRYSPFSAARVSGTKRTEVMVLERRSPSRLSEGERVDLSLRLRREAREAMEQGSLFHAWMECIEWLEEGEPPRGHEAGVQIRLTS